MGSIVVENQMDFQLSVNPASNKLPPIVVFEYSPPRWLPERLYQQSDAIRISSEHPTTALWAMSGYHATLFIYFRNAALVAEGQQSSCRARK